MTPHSHALTMENQADMLAEALWEEAKGTPFPPLADDYTRVAIKRVIKTLEMILAGDIRSPQDMAAEVEGRTSGTS